MLEIGLKYLPITYFSNLSCQLLLILKLHTYQIILCSCPKHHGFSSPMCLSMCCFYYSALGRVLILLHILNTPSPPGNILLIFSKLDQALLPREVFPDSVLSLHLMHASISIFVPYLLLYLSFQLDHPFKSNIC